MRLNENQLKMIAVVTMAVDHIGYFLFPQVRILRWIGRLAFPIFAYFIAEGCYYTRNIWRYLLQVGGLGLICMAVTAAFDGSIYGNILITFALSILIVGLMRIHPLIGIACCAPVLWLCRQIEIDYSLTGILIPVGCWAALEIVRLLREEEEAEKCGEGAEDRKSQISADRECREEGIRKRPCMPDEKARLAELCVMTAGLLILAYQLEPYQWMGLFTLPLLFLYNGRRGEKNLKWFFYLFYPLHIAVIQVIAMAML